MVINIQNALLGEYIFKIFFWKTLQKRNYGEKYLTMTNAINYFNRLISKGNWKKNIFFIYFPDNVIYHETEVLFVGSNMKWKENNTTTTIAGNGEVVLFFLSNNHSEYGLKLITKKKKILFL